MPDLSFLLEHDDRAVGVATNDLACCGEPDDPAADDSDIINRDRKGRRRSRARGECNGGGLGLAVDGGREVPEPDGATDRAC